MADAIISIVVDQLSIIINDQIQDVRAALGVKEEIKNLSSKLNKMRAVLNDAERRSFKDESVKLWVDEIKNICYDVEDVVDEWSTKTRRQQRERSSSPSEDAAGSCSSFLQPSCFHFKKIVMRRDIANKIKELDSRLDRITKQKDQFNFLATTCDHEWKRVPTTAYVDASEIQGRESDASALISKLVEDNNNNNGLPPVVISIVGGGGIGKTTLAQLVYEDEQIKAHFDERVWVCVSDPFDEIKIAKAIVQSTTKTSTDLSELQMLLENIHTTLSQKRFLLVLDDVWTEEDAKWAPFKNCLLNVGLPGSRILVTSRSERVAKMMGSVYMHRVEVISDSDAWLLLSRIAFSGRSSSNSREQKLKEIGKQIAQKCQGLPLAVKVMGSLLRCKDTEEEWQDVLSKLQDGKSWEMEKVETDLFPHLYLSYNDLTPYMKQCFSYCAIFPKDYEIKVDELIRIWMAQGYLETTNDNSPMELKGREVFGNLAMRSMFQDFKKDDDLDSNIITSCKMHDIVHDFVKFLTKNECYSDVWQEDKGMKIENLRHLLWQKTRRPKDSASICNVIGPTDLASIFNVIGKLRSFSAEQLVPHRHTRHLFNGLKFVRVLILYGCHLKAGFPKEIGDLIHLRYIDFTWCNDLVEITDSICSLDNLQTLVLKSCVWLSKLPERIGKLSHLRHIDLSWTIVEELPESIFSLKNLQTLNLQGCNVLSRLSEGIGKLCHLSRIDISKSKIKELPDSISLLVELKILNLEECSWLYRLPDSICSTLPKLQILNLARCTNLSRLPERIGDLHQLKLIDLSRSKVEELPDSICSLNNLHTLNLQGCENLRLPERIGDLRQLKLIDLSMSKVEELPDSICSLDNLHTLNLARCENLSRLPERIGDLRQLKLIDLSKSKVEELPDSICSLYNLHTLNLARCKNLSRLPEGIGSLRQLRLIDLSMSKVKELPDSIESLKDLKILRDDLN